MLKLSKRHTLEIRQEVLVYFNLHKRVFSLKDVKTGHVIFVADTNIDANQKNYIKNSPSR